MKILLLTLAMLGSLHAKESWHLELKDGTVFTLKMAPEFVDDFYKFKLNDRDVIVPAKSVISLTAPDKWLERFLYVEAEENILVEENRKAIVRVESKLHKGSGTIINPNGYILTNNHLVSNNHEISITLHDGVKRKAKLIAKSILFDLAILKLEVEADELFSFVKFGDERALGKRPKVYTFSTSEKAPWKKVSADFVSKVEYFGIEDGMLYQQYSISMSSDNTGSPIFSDNGSFIGLVTQKTKSIQSNKIWFSTPATFVKTIMQNINAYVHNPTNTPIRYNDIEKK